MEQEHSHEVQALYHKLINAWNSRDAEAMAEPFAREGEMIGFDGSQSIGQAEIFEHLKPIFQDHPTARFVTKVKSIVSLGADAAVLRAIAGMVPVGQTELNPKVNTHHTLVAVQRNGTWRIQLFQNTPAQFHGRPQLVEQMTEELRQQL